jgi:hypothetical protein
MEKKARVFVSHSSKDKPFVRKLVEALKEHDLNVWFDEAEIKVGDSIVTRISEGLDSAYLIVVLSKASVESPWVREEMNAALMDEISGKGGVVLPVLMEPCEIPPLLRSRLYADFTGDFDLGLKKLLAVFEQENEPPADVTAAATRSFAPSCTEALAALRLADLRRRMTARMSRSEVGILWFDLFEVKMDDEMPGRPIGDCVIDLIDRARKRNKLRDLFDSVCTDRQDLADLPNP